MSAARLLVDQLREHGIAVSPDPLAPPVGDRDYRRGTRLPHGGAGPRPGCRRQVASACEFLRHSNGCPGGFSLERWGHQTFCRIRGRRRGATLFWVGLSSTSTRSTGRPNPYSRKIRNACGSEEAANVRKTRSIRVITLPLLSVVSSAPMRCESRRSSSTLDSARKRLHTGLTNVF